MTSTLRNAAFGAALLAAAASPLPLHAQQSDANSQSGGGSSGVSIDELNKEFKSLSPEARSALMRQLEQRGIDGLSHMNEQDARTAFAGLPPGVRTELQAKWDSMSDEQHEALKKLSPDTVKQMVADKIKQSFLPSTETMEKAKATTDKMKEYLKQWWTKISGKTTAEEN